MDRRGLDLVLRDNAAAAVLNGLLNVSQAQRVTLLGSTLINNRGTTVDSVAISISAAAQLSIRGSVIHNPGGCRMLALRWGHQGDDLRDAGTLLGATDGVVMVLHALGQVPRDAPRDDGFHLRRRASDR